MSQYVDGFVIPIPKSKIEDYKRLAEKAAPIWKEYGALEYWECIGDDLEVKEMKSFPQIANAGPDETVVFSWIVYKSREHRDEVNAKIMTDQRLKDMCNPGNAPFEFKRMAYGGFRPFLHL